MQLMQLMEIRQTFNIFLPIFMILVCPAINCVNNFRDHNGVKLAMLTLQNFDRHNKPPRFSCWLNEREPMSATRSNLRSLRGGSDTASILESEKEGSAAPNTDVLLEAVQERESDIPNPARMQIGEQTGSAFCL